MRDVAFGQYYPSKSFSHKLDPRTKILFLILYIVCVFLSADFYGLGACALAFVLVVCFSGIRISSLFRTMKGILFLLVFMSLLNLFFYQGETETPLTKPIFGWEFTVITKEAVYHTCFLAVRLVLLVLGSSMLTLTTTPVALADGLESLLTPLKWIKFPVHELALIMSIALRFIPILTDETGRIMNAQKARGGDFESGNLFKRVKALLPVLIPLLISAFRRAEELGDAMDARCYSGSKVRTKYKKLTFGWRDILAWLFGAVLLAGVIVLKIYPLAIF